MWSRFLIIGSEYIKDQLKIKQIYDLDMPHMYTPTAAMDLFDQEQRKILIVVQNPRSKRFLVPLG
jgi:hypothetical protein